MQITVRLTGQARCVGARIGAHNTTVTPLFERSAIAPTTASVTFTVPARVTRGLAFDVSCPRWPNIDAVPTVVLQYRDVSPGATPATDTSGRPTGAYASYCWTGTTTPTATIVVRGWVNPATTGPLSGGVSLYADPSVATVASSRGGRWLATYDGGLAHQDEPYC